MYMLDVQHVHMKEVTLTELRRNIFQLVDEALATGEPIVIRRKGRRVVVQAEETAADVAVETEEEHEGRWRKFWAEPPPGAQNLDLSVEELRRIRQDYWRWDGEPALDP